jgi:phosphonate transport system substrate-binding protein
MKPGKRQLVPYAALLRLLLGVAALAAPGAALSAESGNDGPGLTFGSVAMDIPAEMHRRLRPLMDYLSAELKRPVQLKLSADLSKAADDLASGNVDIAYLTPVAYIKAQRAGGARLVAKTVTRGEKSFQLMLVVRHDSPIKSVRDLAGKSFAFGDPAAILQRAVLVNAGLRLEQLGSHKFIGHYDNIARGVASGDFDAGILKDTTAYEWERKGLRILHASPPLPPYNIAVSRRVDEPTRNALRQALLHLNPRDPAHGNVVESLDKNYDGFAPVTDAEYDVVRMLVKPFEK